MIRATPSSGTCTQCFSRVKAWLATRTQSRLSIAKAAGVEEKTLRVAEAEGDRWNPTVRTLQKLEAVIPNDWTPPRNNGKRKAAA
jgi:transcriptional regulator with XRE-family HTH domain